MELKVKRSPLEIEKEFNNIKYKINQYILKNSNQIPSENDFQKLDIEFQGIKKEYEQQKDTINLLHVEHNYLWSKAVQCLHKDPTQSLSLIIAAMAKLFDRHKNRNYGVSILENMLGAYESLLIKTYEKRQFINFQKIEGILLSLIENYFLDLSLKSKKIENIINIISSIFVEIQDYDKKVSELKLKSSNLKESELLVGKIKNTLRILENVPSRKHYSTSLCYEALYRLRKKQLHFLVRFVFFEKSEEKKKKMQNSIDQITEEMIRYSTKSLKTATNFIKKSPSDKQKTDKVKLMITLKEIDNLTAEYYKTAYSDKDILKAWAIMDKIKRFLVMKAFKENVPISEGLLKYYGEEWSLLYTFAKICLLKEEVSKRKSSLSQEWEKEMFTGIINSLDDIERLFKYEIIDKKDYTLRIMTSSFAGGFSEYFIHELCREFFDHGNIDKNTPSEFECLLTCVKMARNKEDIRLNETIDQGKPDIDIYIKNKCAIFLKNSQIDYEEITKIWNEIVICKKTKTKRIFYGINFIKNIERIEYIRKSFEKIKNSYSDINIDIFDIKDLVSIFLTELKRSGKSKLNFSHMDLYRVLDY